MTEDRHLTTSARAAGYAALIDRYDLRVLPNWHRSVVGRTASHRVDTAGAVVEEAYPARRWPGDGLGDQLEFALKYDGTNLAILDAVFRAAPEGELLEYLRSKPTGKYARRLWFLFEWLTGQRLPIEDLDRGNYVDLLEPEQYYTAEPARRARRQRIKDNLPGDRRLCPLVRRTEVLREYEVANLPGRCREVVGEHPPELLARALSYLYSKETRSSFEIERVRPDASRAERFVALLRLAEREDFCDKARLIELQNRTVESRFRDRDYRTSQNYVGETVAYQRERIHYVSPRPEDLPELMEGLIAAHERMEAGQFPAVVHAAVLAYGFVYLHPFEDGNGRIHRFLIHNVLARRGFSPEGLMFPVSAAMLKSRRAYDASLEAFSRPLMSLVEYSLDEEGRMTVHNDTAVLYRYLDLTPQTEALFRFVEQTIETELAPELAFLAGYDRSRDAIRGIVDMPDRLIDLFIRFCLQNDGRLSARKRTRHFDLLTDDEIARMEEAVREGYGR